MRPIGLCAKRLKRTAFTRSAIGLTPTPPKVNRLRWNMEHCEHIVGGGPQALADFGCVPRSSNGLRESRIFCHANNARFHRFPSDPWDKFYNIWTQQSIGEALKTFWNRDLKILLQGSFPKKKQKLLKRFPGLATSGPHNSAMITNAENSRPNGPSSPLADNTFYSSKANYAYLFTHQIWAFYLNSWRIRGSQKSKMASRFCACAT